MHEFGLCESFVEAITNRAAGRRVTGVRVRIGTLHRVDNEAFAQAFEFVMTGTVADGAVVEVVTTPAILDCPGCGVRAESDELLALCPACGGVDLQLVGGNELVLESIRLADPASGHAPERVEHSVPPEPDDGHTHAPAPVTTGGV